ncbi:ABC transporter ATP-binding protein [Desulfolutivibrio sulfoxidireducens]|uniref:ABC transporter ATP-binding protein n=1 Tax=Desulfolutivibrio sulfoxidireducens TaxID=2773299 RepID=UPI00159CFBF0|nr:ABC transporter ATP-binding protein [Desulfolutivibrio sulfoxidireducens]QLA17771.1 ATP-binding cassette domain-containing protein [Desulfolutivibrio sulfoxidireducens]QLA21348.1 ATP-binding cassette domain-containing protein [Desulfolutivibrio sulfoxidireducens]
MNASPTPPVPGQPPSPIVRLVDIRKSYLLGDVTSHVLRDVSLTIESGEFTAVQGPSGSGKSTLLHILGLLDRPTSGSYFLCGENVAELDDDALSARRNATIGFVFQSFYLIPYATALDNVLLPGMYADTPRHALRERGLELLRQVGLADRAGHKPSQLSGGQQQRVALARALVNDPDLILADEPTGQLDSVTGEEIMSLLADINARSGKTVVVVTHDDATAAHARRRILVHDGRVV